MKTPTQNEIIALAGRLQQENRKLSSQAAITEAIQQLIGAQVVPSPAPGVQAKPRKADSKKAVPEHVMRNINRVKRAEQEREKTGGKLPTATFVQGGKVSPK